MAIKISLTNRILNDFRGMLSADTYEERELVLEDIRQILVKYDLDNLVPRKVGVPSNND